MLMGTLGISTAYGMLLLLPLYVQELGGNEADFGVILAAGAVPAVLCIGAVIRYPDAMRPHMVVAIAVAVYAAGSAGASLVSGTWTPLIGIGVLLGTAWAVAFAVTPMAMSEMVTDEGRATYFGYVAGTQQLGIGSGPVLGRLLVEAGLGYRGAFLAAGAVCAVATALLLVIGTLAPDGRREGARSAASEAPSLGSAVRCIARSEAVFSLGMLVLFACTFTSMTSFQTTFASAQGLDFAIYYITYTVAVIFSRFVLAGATARYDARLVIATAVSAMAMAIAAFLLVGSSTFLYGAASAALGLGYGLALPTVQAHAVNVSEDEVRPRVLPIGGLLFQAANLGFPLIAGWIIAGFGYQALFTVLLAFVLAQAAVGWWRFVAARGVADEGLR